MKYDYLIVGAGFAGSVMAERMAQAGKKVLLIDQRDHIGGNAYDYYNEHGILVHAYGLHIFHTNSKDVFHYLSRFTGWRFYEHRVKSFVDGELKQFPPRGETINNATDNTSAKSYIVSKAGQDIWDKYYHGYTLKQWGRDGAHLPASTAARVPVRNNHDDRYFTDEFQFMPKDGYTKMFENMLDHENITVELGADFQSIKNKVDFDRLIYTGSMDSYYNYCFGGLPYRSLKFEHSTGTTGLDAAQINYPDIDIPYTRAYEHKQFTGQQHEKTTVTHEFPCNYQVGQNPPFYPVRDDAGDAMYCKYQQLGNAEKKVLFLGRLGLFRYYNMDQVVAQALSIAAKEVN